MVADISGFLLEPGDSVVICQNNKLVLGKILTIVETRCKMFDIYSYNAVITVQDKSGKYIRIRNPSKVCKLPL